MNKFVIEIFKVPVILIVMSDVVNCRYEIANCLVSLVLKVFLNSSDDELPFFDSTLY